MSGRRVLIGAMAFTVAMVVAIVRAGEEPAVHITTQATTTTTGSPIPPPPVPAAEGVTNFHRRTTLEEICADPESPRALESSGAGA